MKEKTIAIILAGGSGVRMNTVTPKQFLRIGGKPIIAHTMLQFENSDVITGIIVVCPKEYITDLNKIVSEFQITKVIKIVSGGETRQESSYNGLKACSSGTKFVLIHDAVRPFVDKKIIGDTLDAAREAGASDTVIKTADTIITKKGKFIEKVPDRDKLRRGQTPQGFKYGTIIKAHKWALKNKSITFTDDCGLVIAMGEPVKIVDGSILNIKLTDQTDLYLAERLFQLQREDVKSSDYRSLHNKVAVVAGGTGDIGREVVTLLEKYGCKAIPVSLTSLMKCDITDEKSVKKCFETIFKKNKKIDILVNVTGILKVSEVKNMKLSDWESVIATNLTGAFILSKNIIPFLKKGKEGHVVHVTSSSYTRGRMKYSAYSASKAALVNFCQALADEVIKNKIYVNVISPQRVASSMRIKNFGEEEKSSLLSPYEVAEKIVEYCTVKATGQIVDVRTQK